MLVTYLYTHLVINMIHISYIPSAAITRLVQQDIKSRDYSRTVACLAS